MTGAQGPQIEAVRLLPDGNWLLKLDGAYVQTITEDQKRDVLKMQIELDAARKELELLRTVIGDYEAMRALFLREREAREKEGAVLLEQLKIREARQAEADAMIRELVKATKRNRIEAALSNPILTLAFKLAVPIAGLWR